MRLMMALFATIAWSGPPASAHPVPEEFDCRIEDADNPLPHPCALLVKSLILPSGGAVEELYAVTVSYSLTYLSLDSLMLWRDQTGWYLDIHGMYQDDDTNTNRQKVRSASIRSVRYKLSDTEVGPLLNDIAAEIPELIDLAPFRIDPAPDCLDGSRLRAWMMTPSEGFMTSRPSCMGRTQLDEYAQPLLEFAIAKDPISEPFLSGMVLTEEKQ